MLRLVGSKVIDVPQEGDGLVDIGVLRGLANTSPDRVLSLVRRDGTMALVPAHGRMRVAPEDVFLEQANARRGS